MRAPFWPRVFGQGSVEPRQAAGVPAWLRGSSPKVASKQTPPASKGPLDQGFVSLPRVKPRAKH